MLKAKKQFVFGVIFSLAAGVAVYIGYIDPDFPVWSFFIGAFAGGMASLVAAMVFKRDSVQQNIESQKSTSEPTTTEHTQKMFLVARLTAGIAHDFNNILTAMLGHVDALVAQSKPTNPGYTDLMQIKKSGLVAAHLVRQLLSFSRQQTVKPVIFDLNDRVSESRDLFVRLCGETVQLHLNVPDDLWIKLDPSQLEQMLLNLIINARDAMPDGGAVHIDAQPITKPGPWLIRDKQMPAGSFVALTIRDTGVGLAPEIIPQIFDPYFTTKGVGKGTGLGLASVDGIIDQAGGGIFAQNHEDSGAVFTLVFPLCTAPTETAQDQRLTRHKTAAVAVSSPVSENSPLKAHLNAQNPAQILVVEDDAAVRFVLIQSLKRMGYRVLDAKTGDEALQKLADLDQKPDLMISDIVMPGMDGPSLLKAVRKDYGDMRAILVSGYADVAERTQVAGDTQAAFLPKPFTSADLQAVVMETLTSDKK